MWRAEGAVGFTEANDTGVPLGAWIQPTSPRSPSLYESLSVVTDVIVATWPPTVTVHTSAFSEPLHATDPTVPSGGVNESTFTGEVAALIVEAVTPGTSTATTGAAVAAGADVGEELAV